MLGAFPSGTRGVTGAKIGTKYVYDLLVSNGYSVKAIDRSLITNSPIDNVLFIYFYRFLNLFNSLLVIFKLLLLIFRFKPTLFYTVLASSKLGFLRDFTILLLVKLFRLKTIAHVRNGNYFIIHGYSKTLLKFYYSFIDEIIFLDESLVNDKTRNAFKSVNIIANPIDNEIVPTISDLDFTRNDNQLNFIFVSNLIKSKGYFDLLEAIPLIDDSKLKNMSFKFYGKFESDIKRDEFSGYIKKNSLAASVHYCGVVYDRALLKEIYVSSDVIILPTYYPNEAQPRCLIEAISSGCLVITTKHASNYSTFGQQDFISYVDKRSPASISAAIERIYDNRANLFSSRVSARDFYTSNFSGPVLDDKLLKVFL